ncbi:putative sodium-dependent transporter [Clonorchis sinensis]|uniref:Sodium-dependent transporter n=1 Tax=Clonorchis sinensis TaxID=79923 RepID=A0A8T1MKI4_CLOSI|nr:putative sodium-dependent transporter [Clonorchis sinensis]
MWKTVLKNSEPISDGLPHVHDFEKFSDGEVATDKESESTVGDIQLRVMEDERTMFQSAIGTVISCLGSAVGTGNIWRFPRILATQSYYRGSLTFYIAWAILLFFWSIPVILVEYAIGRFTKNSPIVSYRKFMGNYFAWLGGWIVVTAFFISAYYSVIIGWCLYYLYVSIAFKELPTTEKAGMEIFDSFSRAPQWPVICQVIAVVIAGIFLFGGIKWIEKANLLLVPLLLAILIFTFGWSLTRPYAEVGIKFLFTPTWESFAEPGLWIAAASQNAFDTGAGLSVLFTYATYMGRSASITKYSVFIPMMNNLVSLYASITIFSTVFSTLIDEDGAMTRSAILQIMQQSGPGSTGLTFTWIPVLFSKVGIFGRVLCALFFLCLTFAGISSLLANIQVYVLTAKEVGVPHRIAVAGSLLACVIVGLPSAIKLEILENQDNTWGYALIVSGMVLTALVIVYNPVRFRRVIINNFGTHDWPVPIIWVGIITVVVPVIFVFLIVWWIYDYIREAERWYDVTWTSVTSTLIEWLVVLIVILVINFVVLRIKRDLYVETRKYGSDPYNPETYEKESVLTVKEVRVAEKSVDSVRTV